MLYLMICENAIKADFTCSSQEIMLQSATMQVTTRQEPIALILIPVEIEAQNV